VLFNQFFLLYHGKGRNTKEIAHSINAQQKYGGRSLRSISSFMLRTRGERTETSLNPHKGLGNVAPPEHGTSFRMIANCPVISSTQPT